MKTIHYLAICVIPLAVHALFGVAISIAISLGIQNSLAKPTMKPMNLVGAS